MNKIIKYFLSITIVLLSIGFCFRSKTQSLIRNNDSQIFVVVGSAAAGQAAAYELSSLLKQGVLVPTSKIIWISADKNQPYDRTGLADYISQEKNLFKDSKQDDSISYLFNTRVTKINKEQRSIELDNGQTITYDKLFLGLGTTPSSLDIPGIQAKGVYQFFTLDDVIAIKNNINKQKQQHAVVLGGGLCALECADALAKCGVSVTIVTKSHHVLNRQIDANDAELVEQAMIKSGIKHYRDTTVIKVIEHNNTITDVVLSDGSTLPADIFVYAIGARPNTWLAKDAGLTLYNEGILVNDYMCSSDPCIYAAGDCTVVKNHTTGLLVNSEKWRDAKRQGIIAAQAMAGISVEPYEGAIIASLGDVFDIRFTISGPLINTGDHDVIIYNQDGAYYKLLLKNGQLKGYFGFNIPRAKVLMLVIALTSQTIIDPKDLVSSSFVRDLFTILPSIGLLT